MQIMLFRKLYLLLKCATNCCLEWNTIDLLHPTDACTGTDKERKKIHMDPKKHTHTHTPSLSIAGANQKRTCFMGIGYALFSQMCPHRWRMLIVWRFAISHHSTTPPTESGAIRAKSGGIMGWSKTVKLTRDIKRIVAIVFIVNFRSK